MKRLILPALALILLVVLVLQMRGFAVGSARAKAPANAAAAVPTAAPTIAAEGRIVAYPGAEVVVGTDRMGVVERLAVSEKSTVHKGDLIAALRADDLRAGLAEARAGISAAQADLALAQVEVRRAESLLQSDLGTQQAVDRARRDRDAAQARIESASASARQLEAVLAKMRIVAPIDGVVLEREVDAGETVREGDPLVKIADLSRLRIEAEVDEFDAGRIVLGAPVTITAEGHAGREWSGRVEEIPDAVVERGLTPRDPGRPTDTRVLRVKIAVAGATPLKLGQRVEVRILASGDSPAGAAAAASDSKPAVL